MGRWTVGQSIQILLKPVDLALSRHVLASKALCDHLADLINGLANGCQSKANMLG
jgi:hypothetical protein